MYKKLKRNNFSQDYILGNLIQSHVLGLTDSGGDPSPVSFYSYAGEFKNTATSQVLNQATFTDLTGTAGDVVAQLVEDKTYGIIMNGKFRDQDGIEKIEMAVVFDNTETSAPQTVIIGEFQNNATNKSWEPWTMATTFTAEADFNTAKLQYKRNSGSSNTDIPAVREFGTYIFEIGEQEQLYKFVADSTLTIDSSTWASPSGFTAGACDITDEKEYIYLAAFQGTRVAVSGVPEINARINFGSAAQTLSPFKTFTFSETEMIPFAGKFTATAAHEAVNLQFQRSNGVGSTSVVSGLNNFIYLTPVSTEADTYANAFTFTKSGNQDINTGSFVDVVVAEAAPTVNVVNEAKYVAMIIAHSGATLFSGALDLQFALNFNSGTQVVSMGIQEIAQDEKEEFCIIKPFTAEADLTNFKLQARLAFDGGLDIRLVNTDEYTVIIKRVS